MCVRQPAGRNQGVSGTSSECQQKAPGQAAFLPACWALLPRGCTLGMPDKERCRSISRLALLACPASHACSTPRNQQSRTPAWPCAHLDPQAALTSIHK